VREMVTVGATEGQDDLGFERLTPRHLSILQLIERGLTNGEIGNKLHLSRYTISQHVSEMFRRTGAVNRADLVARAHQAGLFNGTRSRPSGRIKDQMRAQNSGN
jgi:DNA-binding NarL/FixJ family response regulator